MPKRDSKSTAAAVTVSGRDALARSVAGARTFAQDCGLERDQAARLCVLVEEVVANLYDHGGLSESDSVGLAFALEPEGVRVVIDDPGPPFDPRQCAAQQPNLERGGGAGIRMLLHWAREIDYETAGGRNRLTLLLPL